MRMVLLIAAAIIVLTACTETRSMNQPTITERLAIDRVEQLIHDTVAVINPKPELEQFKPSLNRRNCVDPTDGGSEERVIVNRRYYLRGIPKDRFTQVAKDIQAHWEKQGHLVTGVQGLEIGEPDLSGRSRPDDFLLSLSWIEGDFLGIGATSTCLWPNGTPEQPAK